MKRGKFYLDRHNGKLFGVCAGIARHMGWDVTWVRAGVVLATLLGAFPWTVIAYGVAAFAAKPLPMMGRFEEEEARSPRFSTRGLREATRDIDRRLAEVDSFVAAPNSRLAHEIESLR